MGDGTTDCAPYHRATCPPERGPEQRVVHLWQKEKDAHRLQTLHAGPAPPRRRLRHAPAAEPFAVHKRTGTFAFCIHFSHLLIAACPAHAAYRYAHDPMQAHAPGRCSRTHHGLINAHPHLAALLPVRMGMASTMHVMRSSGMLLTAFLGSSLVGRSYAGTRQALFHQSWITVHMSRPSTSLFQPSHFPHIAVLESDQAFALWRCFIDIAAQQVLLPWSDVREPRRRIFQNLEVSLAGVVVRFGRCAACPAPAAARQ